MLEQATGILKRRRDGAVLVDAAQPATEEVTVPARLAQTYGLVEGATVTGPAQGGRHGPELADVTTVCGVSPEAYRARKPFEQLVAVNPSERFDLGASGDVAMRAVDLWPPSARARAG